MSDIEIVAAVDKEHARVVDSYRGGPCACDYYFKPYCMLHDAEEYKRGLVSKKQDGNKQYS